MYIYAETAFHHEGDINYLKRLVSAVARTGCQGIKFQVLPSAADFISSRHSQYSSLASYCLNMSQWDEVFSHTSAEGLEIVLMPLSLEALTLADQHEVRFLDVHSVSFYDERLLEAIQVRDEKIILGIGGRTNEEIEQFYKRFQNRLKVLMLGFQSFPSKLSEIRLGRIADLKRTYSDLEIGYADHSGYDEEDAVRSNEYASLLGATFFEKHVTLDEGVKRVDYESAVGIERFKLIIERLNFVKKNIVDGSSVSMFPSERKYRDREAKLVASRDIKSGETFSLNNLALKMTDMEAPYSRYDQVLGKTAHSDIMKDSPITNLD
ncbi:MAG: N-acetylneuraminate synthase family protein [Flavobacteriales bacterium]|nr:N-acetylneuraminate synthase family protein [Flavobacteriales bacterium]